MHKFHWLAMLFVIPALTCGGFANGQQGTIPSKPKVHVFTYFDKDPRLAKRLTLPPVTLRNPQLWLKISRATEVPLEREQAASEFDGEFIVIRGNDVSARAVMDANAALYLTRWERTKKERPKKEGYRLLVPQSELEFAYGDRENDAIRQRNQAGARFLQGLNTLSDAERRFLLSSQPFQYSSLPDSMKQPMVDMLDALAKEYPHSLPYPSGRLALSTLMLQRQTRGDINLYRITVQGPGQSTSFKINDYEYRQQQQDAERRKRERAGELSPLYVPTAFEIPNAQAKKRPELKKVVQLDLDRATLVQTLIQLHEKYDIPFVTDPPPLREKAQRVDIHLGPMPLGEVLDKLTQLYKDTEWEWRKYGFLVVRGPFNHARDPKQGQTLKSNFTILPSVP